VFKWQLKKELEKEKLELNPKSKIIQTVKAQSKQRIFKKVNEILETV
jgi:hypothetical protein